MILVIILVSCGTTNQSSIENDEYIAFDASQYGQYPDHWQFKMVEEPVFHSNMFVLETGVEHDQTVVLIHGLGNAGFKDWIEIIPALEQNYHVVAMDLPGFGYSDRPIERYSPSNYSEIMHWLVEQTAKSKVVVVGSSMGGAIALRYAENHPENIDKLVLVDIAGILERTAITKHLAELPSGSKYFPDFINRGV